MSTANSTEITEVTADGNDIAEITADGVVVWTSVDETPPTTPGDPTVSNISENSMDVSWTASSDNEGVDHYIVEYTPQ